jgi:hypothetical protein
MTASPNGTIIQQGIIDAAGVWWTINDVGQVAANGVGDASTGNVIAIAYVNGQIWQQNNALRWWYKTTNPTGTAWLPAGGTMSSPIAYPPSAPTDVTAS